MKPFELISLEDLFNKMPVDGWELFKEYRGQPSVVVWVVRDTYASVNEDDELAVSESLRTALELAVKNLRR